MDFNLNEKQWDAIRAPEQNTVIIAPAGSGKTTTLTAAIKYYKELNPMANVVAITFTNKATEDLYARLGTMPFTRISTIHSWAYNELVKLSEKQQRIDPGNSFKIKLLQDEKIKEILGELVRKRRYNYVKIDILFIYVMGNFSMNISDRLKAMFDAIRRDYIDFKEKQGLYDFTDLPQYLLDKMLDYDAYIEDIDGLFVDEFQDVDDVQLQIFDRVLATKKVYIGDPRQSIYQFRGATPEVLKQLKGFTSYELDINYRSHQEIIDFANTFQDSAANGPITPAGLLESYRSKIKCERGEGGVVYTLPRTGSAYKINEYIKESGEKIVREFLELNPMILCRKNKEVKEIQDLGWKRVQTVHQAKGLEYDAVIATDFETEVEEDINIMYVAMTRAKTHLLVADYKAFIRILEKIIEKDGFLGSVKIEDLF